MSSSSEKYRRTCSIDEGHLSVKRLSRRKQTIRQKCIRWFAAHQIETSAVPIACILGANSFTGPPRFSLKSLHPLHIPSLDPTWHLESIPSRFLFLSYVDPKTGLCLKGPDDFYLVVFWVFAWTFLREASMRWFWSPLARVLGVKTEGNINRFAEQGWGLMYAAAFWTLGMYIYETSPYAHPSGLLLPTKELWKGYPHFSLAPLTKFYYLVQMAFWIQTLLIINVEKRRKDYAQMLTHHIVTVALVTTSYATNWTRVGTVILCTMDFCDILLPLAKMVKYVNLPNVADGLFGLFLLAWIVTRQIFFPIMVYSVIFDISLYVPHVWDPSTGRFFPFPAHVGFAILLCGLQVMMCIWLYMILRVVVKVLKGGNADDVRSDSEEDAEDEEGDEEKKEILSERDRAEADNKRAMSKIRRRSDYQDIDGK